MVDRLTPEQRHKTIKNIHSADTSIEVRLRKALWYKGIRYRKIVKGLPGTPDIAITKWKIAVLYEMSFWQGKILSSIPIPIGLLLENAVRGLQSNQ